MKASVEKIDLQFITPGKTSRGTLHSKPSWFLILEEQGKQGIGECSVIPGLHPEYNEHYEDQIHALVRNINSGQPPVISNWDDYPSIRFGLETALINLKQNQEWILFPSDFTLGKTGIAINGLIWMGNKEEMQMRIKEKLDKGFNVLKLKVGAIDFEDELSLLNNIRSTFSLSALEIRLDANGAFTASQALNKLQKLSHYQIHSLEQPIQAGHWEQMAQLCKQSPIPIALDEELIGIKTVDRKKELLSTISPQYIILKPSLLGGLEKSAEWITLAQEHDLGWWSTSALESNIGLNAIAQWVYTYHPTMVQGLGTGQLYSNNIASPLRLRRSKLFFNASRLE